MSDAPGALGLGEHFFRHQRGRVVAGLLRTLGARHFELAEEAAGEAFARAIRTWPLRGLPERPGNWLFVVARNYAVDELRRAQRFAAALPEVVRAPSSPASGDDQLSLTFMCCHPVLQRRDQVALTLKAVAGLGTPQIAAAFLVPEATIAQRLVRAKRRLLEAEAVFELPDSEALPARLEAVLDVLYLAYTAGHQQRGVGDAGIGLALVEEALRLGQALVARHETETPTVHALLALILLSSARFPARLVAGEFVPLDQQDRGLWDRQRLTAGLGHLARAGSGTTLSSFHLQAGVEACHAVAPAFADTDWARIVALYADLLKLNPSPVLRLNWLVARSRAGDPAQELVACVEALRSELAGYAPLHAALADLRTRLGERELARAELNLAHTHSGSEPERRWYARRARDLEQETLQ